ncbi:hypothetical protein [Paenibacillus koleovorans]|uniref:hypothetical protein n=1 Tax=Paenibacillus koleovorans TaxID=121608 RepID=UPI000FD6FD59|nr:hypothetical protein [Paenibacillus koleovorans]
MDYALIFSIYETFRRFTGISPVSIDGGMEGMVLRYIKIENAFGECQADARRAHLCGEISQVRLSPQMLKEAPDERIKAIERVLLA